MPKRNKKVAAVKKEKIKSVVSQINRISRTRTNISELTQALIMEFGGPDGYAREFCAVYALAKTNNNTKTRADMLKTLSRMVEIDTELNGRGVAAEKMDDQDIDLELNELLGNAIESVDDETRNEPGLSDEVVGDLQEAGEIPDGPRDPDEDEDDDMPSRPPSDDDYDDDDL